MPLPGEGSLQYFYCRNLAKLVDLDILFKYNFEGHISAVIVVLISV
jgi:hypothetical protein